MEAGVGPLDPLINELRIQHRPVDEHRPAAVQQMDDVLPAPGAEVVEDHHLVAASDQGIGKMSR